VASVHEGHVEPAVTIGLREIYDEVVATRRQVDLLVEADLPKRVRSIEIRQWGIPANVLVTLAGIGAALLKAG
jgi:hypothetical protein